MPDVRVCFQLLDALHRELSNHLGLRQKVVSVVRHLYALASSCLCLEILILVTKVRPIEIGVLTDILLEALYKYHKAS